MSTLDDLPADEQARILKLRLDRAQRALLDAETALEGRMRELDRANKDLSQRESELVEKLEIESQEGATVYSLPRNRRLAWAP